MWQFFQNHKTFSISLGTAVLLSIVGIYLYALFLPGLWYNDAFLYQQQDGSFAGSDQYADYHLSIDCSAEDPEIEFRVNDVTRNYQIRTGANSSVQVLENGVLVFQGTVYPAGDSYLLVNSDSAEADIQINIGTVPTVDSLFPSYSWLYQCTVQSPDIRGTPAFLIFIFLIAAVLVLDIRFPDLFFHLRYRPAVTGGEPSDWYRLSQKISRIILAAMIPGCMIASFLVH